MFNTKDIDSQRFVDRVKMLLERSNDSHDIYTPLELCQEVVSKVPSLQGNILAIANLEFVYTLKRMEVPLENIHFATPCPLKAMAVKSLLAEHNVFTYNGVITKKDVGDMKFDVVVGNPPYQEGTTGKNKTLFDDFYYQAVAISKKYVIFIAPTMWMTSTKKSLTNLREFLHQNGLYRIDEINAQQQFKVIIDSLGITYQDLTSTPPTHNIHLLNGSVVTATNDGSSIVLTSDPIALSILSKVKTGRLLNAVNSNLRSVGRDGTCANGEANLSRTKEHRFKMVNKVSGGEISYAYTRSPKNVHAGKFRVAFSQLSTRTGLGTITILTDTSSTTSRAVVYVPTDTIEEATSLKTYLESKTFRFVLTQFRTNTLNAVGMLSKLPVVDLTRSWTDEELYAHFNLTDEEIKLIEDTIK